MNSLLSLIIFFIIGFVSSKEDENKNFTVTHVAWFEIEARDFDGPGDDFRGKFSVALFGEVAPMTVLNFVAITKGHKSRHVKNEKLHYKGTPIHRIVKDFVIQMGDITKHDGTGGASIYGPKFNDEEFILSHRSPGWISMANHGPDTNSSQFFILLTKARWLDRKHVVFGKVVKGFDVVETLGEAETIKDSSTPRRSIKIVDCGVKTLETPYVLKPSEVDSTTDIDI